MGPSDTTSTGHGHLRTIIERGGTIAGKLLIENEAQTWGITHFRTGIEIIVFYTILRVWLV